MTTIKILQPVLVWHSSYAIEYNSGREIYKQNQSGVQESGENNKNDQNIGQDNRK